MDSINTMLANVNNIDYSSLEKLADGTYNKGEIDLQKGIFGRYSFEKINNHVGSRADKNTVVRTAEQNLKTKAAVFKAIVTRFAGSAEQQQVDDILSYGIDSSKFQDTLESFKNPYIKEAYKFLMGDGAPLTRDEMRLLDNMLKDGNGDLEGFQPGQVFRPSREFAYGEVSGRVRTLEALKHVKAENTDGLSDRVVENAKQWIKGLSVANISDVTKSRVIRVSTNVLANSNFRTNPVDSVIGRYMPDLYNSCTENVLKVSWPTANKTVDKACILKMVRCISAGLEDKINAGWDAYARAVPEENRPKVRANKKDVHSLRPVTKDDIRATVLSTIDGVVEKMFRNAKGKGSLAGKVSLPVQDAANAEMNDFEKSIYKSLSGANRLELEESDIDLWTGSEPGEDDSFGDWD